jgi:hypothetical protein
MEQTITTPKSQLTSSPAYNPYFYGSHEIKYIIIFKDGEVLASVRWFGSNNEYKTVNFDFPIERKIKEDLTKKQAYYKPVKSDSYERGLFADIYIHADLVNFKALGERVHMDTDTYTSYIFDYEISLTATTRDSQEMLPRRVRFSADRVSRTEYKEFQKHIDRVETMLKEKNVQIPSYELQQLLKHFDVTPKKQK